MVKRKATVGDEGAQPKDKKVSPDRLYHTKSHTDASVRPADHVRTSASAHPPPGADTLICVEEVPDYVEHPVEEVLLHNSAVIERKIRSGIRQRETNAIKHLTTDEVVERLGLPLQQRPTCRDSITTQLTMTVPTAHNPYSQSNSPDDTEIAVNSKWVKSKKFEAVQLAIDDFNVLSRYMHKEGVPACNPFYKYISRSSTAKIATTTGQHVPINSFVQVKDLQRCLRELQTMIDRLLGPARVPAGST